MLSFNLDMKIHMLIEIKIRRNSLAIKKDKRRPNIVESMTRSTFKIKKD